MPRLQAYLPDDLHEAPQETRRARIRRRPRAGSAVDAIVVAIAESGDTVLSGDKTDIEALAAYADLVVVEIV